MDRIFNKIFTPLQLLSIGFALLILMGTFLLMLPVSSKASVSQSFIDALFTATSAVSTTGLIVVDTPTFYSLFGQIVILVLIQFGGLGYIVFFVLGSLLFKERLSINGKKFLRVSSARLSNVDLIRFAKLTVIFALVIETVGVAAYFAVWIKDFPFLTAFYLSLFHSVSAFCTAGFSLFTDSISSYRSNLWININSNFLVITGALGFFVLYDITEYFKQLINRNPSTRLSVHSKIVFSFSAGLIIAGSVLLYFFEGDKFSANSFENILISSFQTISASTTVGFNTIDIGSLTSSSLFFIILLMFIGASPGGTGGGIKITSFAVFTKFSLSILKGRKTTSFFKRSINIETYNKSIVQIMVALFSIICFTLLLTVTEKFDFLKLLFEAVSAFGTVGLSEGITASLSPFGKISIILLMFIGRIGPLAIGLSLFQKAKNKNFNYPEEEILIS